jgi:hypothetical protein
MRLPGLLVALLAACVALLATACRALPPGTEGPDAAVPFASPSASGSPASSALDGAAGPPQVQLTWRLFEIQHEIRNGNDVQSAVFELLVNGGSPSRIALGRRSSFGCVVREGGGAGPLTRLECRAGGRDDVAVVVRAGPDELRAEAYEQDHAHPDDRAARTHPASATIAIPAGADVVVDPGLSRIPDETPSEPTP